MSDPTYKVWARIEREHDGEYEDVGEPVQLFSCDALANAARYTVIHDEQGAGGAFPGWTDAQIEASEMHDHTRTPEAFVALVAAMLIEGDCEEHQHNLQDCIEGDSGLDGMTVCCSEGCTAYAPVHQDGDTEALYELIATARQMEAKA